MAQLQLLRHPGNPILGPSQHWWETRAVFNPGVARYGPKVVMLYRAQGDDYISRLGYAESDDGIRFRRFNVPRYDPPVDDPLERIGAEDPRITKVGDQYYILYTAASLYPANQPLPPTVEKISISKGAPFRVRIALAQTDDFEVISHRGHLFGNLDSKDATVFPKKFGDKFYILHRVFPNVTLATSPDCITCSHDSIIARPRKGSWDSVKIGAGAQPIETRYGWLLIYHGVDDANRYHLGIMLLGLRNPRKVLYRSPTPILSPEKPYERKGMVDNVVFTCGAIEHNGSYYVYYGGADKVIGLATVPVKKVEALLQRQVWA